MLHFNPGLHPGLRYYALSGIVWSVQQPYKSHVIMREQAVSSQQITTSFLLPSPICCSGLGAMTRHVVFSFHKHPFNPTTRKPNNQINGQPAYILPQVFSTCGDPSGNCMAYSPSSQMPVEIAWHAGFGTSITISGCHGWAWCMVYPGFGNPGLQICYSSGVISMAG